ncbi:putative elongator complex protein 1 [Microbotryomycetes sp. JL221]|nr:putative elongator complex protein 1 [Microbotryomycetes sp. JL221]
MKSLVLLAAQATATVDAQAHVKIQDVAFNTISAERYVLTRSSELDQTRIEILRFGDVNQSSSVISWLLNSTPATEALELKLVAAFKFLAESESLSIVFMNGDIEQVSGIDEFQQASRASVGAFEDGIKAAEWSPDEESLAIVTG